MTEELYADSDGLNERVDSRSTIPTLLLVAELASRTRSVD
jgi:hypothetical protein